MSVTFNHTGITVRDLARAEAMFRELFGFHTIDHSPRDPAIIEAVVGVPGAEVDIVYMQNGAARIELLCYSAPEQRAELRPRPCDLGSLHLAVNVSDLDAALARALAWPLQQAGQVVTIDSGPNVGSRIVYLRSPEEGLIVEMIQKPADA